MVIVTFDKNASLLKKWSILRTWYVTRILTETKTFLWNSLMSTDMMMILT